MFEIIKSMRPQQWAKNLLVLAALVFSKHLFDTTFLLLSLQAFGLFCLLSGSI